MERTEKEITRILFVEDHASLAYIMCSNLEMMIPGIQVLRADSCWMAREIALETGPELIITDVRLADGDGLELLEELSAMIPGVRAIVTSGAPPNKNKRSTDFAFLPKPYEPQDLVDLVKSKLGLRRNDKTDEGPSASSPPHSETPFRYDPHHLRNRLAALLAGLRVLQVELTVQADDPQAVLRIANEQAPRLIEITGEISRMLRESEHRRLRSE